MKYIDKTWTFKRKKKSQRKGVFSLTPEFKLSVAT